MSRIAREIIFNESNFFHVLVQGIAKSYIFETEKYKNYYLKFISEKLKTFKVSILAFCIMGNHAHFLVSAEEKTEISKFFQELNVTYAQFYNRDKKRVGYVFRNRFRAEPIRDEKYLLNCISYIHKNPVKTRIVEIAEEYSFSSASNYEKKTGLIDFSKLEEVFGGIPDIKGIEEEIDFIEDEYENKLELGDAIEQAMIKLNVRDVKKIDDEKLKRLVLEIRKNTKTSLRELALIFEINRERLRKVMSFATSP